MPSLPLPLSVSQAAEVGGLQSTPAVGEIFPKVERVLSSAGKGMFQRMNDCFPL